jgi:NAD(P)-dependent dehydrogenase (short-subunit alcohol dehydrogenase family)
MTDYLRSLFDLTGRVAALSGGAGYLVSDMARALASAGARVAILDINLERAEQVASALREGGDDAMAVRVDVTNRADWEAARDMLIRRHGAIDMLVNGAGTNAPTPFLDISLEEWHQVLAVQLTGTMLGCQVIGRRMVEQGRGSIVNISSASAGPPLSRAFTYSVAKAGVRNLTQNLAREWATAGVRVNALRPGFFPTEWSRTHFLTEERVQAILAHTPMRRFGEPGELVGAVIWLCSDAASFVTGAEVAVDGGFSAMTI